MCDDNGILPVSYTHLDVYKRQVLWGYTSKDSLDVLEQFFPEPKSSEKQAGK